MEAHNRDSGCRNVSIFASSCTGRGVASGGQRRPGRIGVALMRGCDKATAGGVGSPVQSGGRFSFGGLGVAGSVKAGFRGAFGCLAERESGWSVFFRGHVELRDVASGGEFSADVAVA